MDIFLTDNTHIYQKTDHAHKICINQSFIVDSNFLSKKSIQSINTQSSNIEYKAEERIGAKIKNFIAENPLNIPDLSYYKTLNTYEQHYDIYFPIFKSYFFSAYCLNQCIEIIEPYLAYEPISFTLFFSSKFFLLQWPNVLTTKYPYTLKIKPAHLPLKDQFWTKHIYRFTQKLNIKKRLYLQQNSIVLFLFEINHHLSIVELFLQKCIAQKQHVSIILLKHPAESNFRIRKALKESTFIHLYQYTDFIPSKSSHYQQIYHNNTSTSPLLKHPLIYKHFLDTSETYARVDHIFKRLKPKVCIQLTAHEITRIVNHVAQDNHCQSVQLDYAVISENINLASQINFNYRLCVSEAIANLWKTQKNMSSTITPIGFCKHDSFKVYTDQDKQSLSDFYPLDKNQQTICFASTWALEDQIYNEEKKDLMKALCVFAHQNKYNLIIRKHPLEKDPIAETAIAEFNYPNQVVSSHKELETPLVIASASVVLTQMSSIFLDCLFYNTPFAFIQFTPRPIRLSGIHKSKYQFPVFNSLDKKFKHWIQNITPNTFRYDPDLLSYYLYKTDQKASERAFHTISDLIQETSS